MSAARRPAIRPHPLDADRAQQPFDLRAIRMRRLCAIARVGLTHAALLLQQQIAAANKGIYEAAQHASRHLEIAAAMSRAGMLSPA